ncbi:hypothetical protein FCV25MIE_34045, partial [Fagus crenata]
VESSMSYNNLSPVQLARSYDRKSSADSLEDVLDICNMKCERKFGKLTGVFGDGESGGDDPRGVLTFFFCSFQEMSKQT